MKNSSSSAGLSSCVRMKEKLTKRLEWKAGLPKIAVRKLRFKKRSVSKNLHSTLIELGIVLEVRF